MISTVHACGLRHPLPELGILRLRRVPPTDISTDFNASILVLGPDALPQLDPAVVRSWLKRGRRCLLFCADSFETRSLRRWPESLTERRLVPLAELRSRLETERFRLESRPARIPMEPSEWLSGWSVEQATGKHVAFVAHALERLAEVHPAHDVGAWARACSVSHRVLWKHMRAVTGRPPSVRVLLYVEAQCRAAQASGIERTVIATALGYADASALGHALGRAAKHVPPPRPRAPQPGH